MILTDGTIVKVKAPTRPALTIQAPTRRIRVKSPTAPKAVRPVSTKVRVKAPAKPPRAVVVQGPPGPAGGEYVHHQLVPAATWTVQHQLETCPAMVLFLDEDPFERIYTDVTYPDLNTAIVEWPTPVTGTAYAR